MRLSTKGRYALEALVMLGYMDGGMKNISTKSISIETKISQSYLEQLFALLKKSSIIISKKGKNGGYMLAKPAADIKVGDIFRAVEGSLSFVKCLEKDCCNRSGYCSTKCLWTKIYENINSVVDNITLQYLINQYKKRLSKEVQYENINQRALWSANAY